ncbi:hypothetical protein LIER_40169 [Lithospermum erythrorhizon]|uniref:Uncharacterized protein n=1 Tax=Lithospermum erythrorhizon TaxID=34254 RepID=A0AAV3QSX0_LITER
MGLLMHGLIDGLLDFLLQGLLDGLEEVDHGLDELGCGLDGLKDQGLGGLMQVRAGLDGLVLHGQLKRFIHGGRRSMAGLAWIRESHGGRGLFGGGRDGNEWRLLEDSVAVFEGVGLGRG